MKVYVHSAGKCGSVSMTKSLVKAGYDAKHIHTFDEKRNSWEFYYIFTPIRELVSRNVSAYFENCYKGGTVTYNDFLEGYGDRHYKGADFFDKRLRKNWGVNVYDYPFDTEQGWHIYNGFNVRVMVIRLEDFRNWPDAFQAMMGKPAPDLMHINKTKHPEYRRFVKYENIPAAYYNQMWGTKFMKHFYSDLVDEYA